MKNILLEAQKRLSFDEKSHTYWLDGNEEKTLLSTTTFLEQFIPPFERDKWSKYVAARDGIPQEEVLQKWNNSSIFSKAFGTKVHLFAECLFTDKQPPKFETEKEKNTFKAALAFYQYAKLNYKDFMAEATLFDEEHGLAGTADLLAQDHEGNWHILDFKTNKELKMENKWRKSMLAPMAHLDDCHLSHYSLQLNMYANMVKKLTGISIKNKVLVHLTEKGYTLYHCKDMQEEIQTLLKNKR